MNRCCDICGGEPYIIMKPDIGRGSTGVHALCYRCATVCELLRTTENIVVEEQYKCCSCRCTTVTFVGAVK